MSGAAAGRPPSTLALAAITAVGSLAIQITVPAVPVIQRDLGVDYATAQLTVTVYLFATGLGQLFIGPISDALGRRPVLITGLALYVVGSVVCALAGTVDILIATRFLQGLGGCAGLVLGRAIIRDVHARERAAGAIAQVTMVMILATMSAAPIGGALAGTVGWRGIFWALAVFGALTLVFSVLRIPETKTADRIALRVVPLLAAFGKLLSYRSFIGYTLTCAFSSGAFFCFLGGGPNVIMNQMGFGPGQFGLAMMSIAVSFVAGNFLSARYAERVGIDRLMSLGCAGLLAGNTLMLVAVLLLPLSIWTLCGTMSVVALSIGLVLANATASMVSVRPDLAGSAAGLGGFIQFAFGALTTAVMAVLAGTTAVPLAAVMAGLGLLVAASFLVARSAPLPVGA